MDDHEADPTTATRMSATDAVMWEIERDPVLRSTITAIAVLDRSPDWDRLRDLVDRATRLIPRFRHRVVAPPLRIGLPRWVVDPQFDLDYHLRRVRSPAPGTLRQVLDLAQPIAMQSFDPARPLWELTLVEGLEGGQAALIQKLHHSLTDGVGGIELAGILLDDSREGPPPEPMPASPPAGDIDPAAVLRASVDDLIRDALGAGTQAAGTATRSALGAVRAPISTVRDATAMGTSMIRALAPIPESESSLLRERGLARRFDTIDVPIADLRASAHAVGERINDALLAAAVGGVAGYHARRGAPVRELRLTMPVSSRTESDPLGANRFAPVRFTVPADIDDAAERMRVLGEAAHHQAAEPFIAHSDLLAVGLDRLPPVVTAAVLGRLFKHCDLVVTNVPGFEGTVYLAGAEVVREYAFAPPTGAALNLALLSMGETACIGVVVDTAAVPDHDLLMECLVTSFEEVLAVAGHHATRSA